MQQKFLFPLSNLNGFICYPSSQDYFFNTLKFLHIDDIVFINAVLRVVLFFGFFCWSQLRGFLSPVGPKFRPWDFSLVTPSAQTISVLFIASVYENCKIRYLRRRTLFVGHWVYKIPKEYEIIRKDLLKDVWEQWTDQGIYWREKKYSDGFGLK